MCTISSTVSMCDSRQSFQDLDPQAKRILSAALNSKTKTSYFKTWCHYSNFCTARKFSTELPIPVANLLNFLTSMQQEGYSSSTLISQVSALSYIQKLFGYQDFSSCFLVKQFLKGLTKVQNNKPDPRLPITLPILIRILNAIPKVINLASHKFLLAAVFSLAFSAFLRIGEICITYNTHPDRVIQRADVQFSNMSGELTGATIVIRNFKNKLDQQPVHVFIPVNSQNKTVCSVRLLFQYLSYFKHSSGPLFQFFDGTPVPYSFVSAKLQSIIRFLNLDSAVYKPHSFRIGAATTAYLNGHSEDFIRRMGRWRSNAIDKYIRITHHVSPRY